ncbi:hypothetical protein FUAX_11830 [Fulvitalea axinellae]|uniref:DUF4468 domain-containing protein n=1 Tax=Fulvitalea axinellae TaxID=1182444 RepID=A0AAU9C9D8_9BACT|nr:hypothetical protein FUAX_11830 [Fulvitalea axinellae]
MKSKYGFVLMAMLFATMGLAQRSDRLFPSELWHKGYMVLMSGDTLKAQIKYDFDNNAALLRHKGTIFSYSTRKILNFEIHDVTSDTYREFFALPYAVRDNYKVPYLFEVLYEGPLTLLSREKVAEETTIHNSGYSSYYSQQPYFTVTEKKLVFDYYILNMKGDIRPVTMRKKDLLQSMRKHSSEIKRYMKRNKLKLTKQEDLVRLVAYYNDLEESGARR